MLLVVEPCTLVFLTVGKNEQTFTVTLAFKVEALIDITVNKLC